MMGTGDFTVDVIAPADFGPPEQSAWVRLRAANPVLWSPYFDPRYLQVCARHAPQPRLAVVHRGGTIIGFLPFQGGADGFARPLGAPLSDQHGMIADPADMPDLAVVCRKAGIQVFPFTGLVTAPPVAGDLQTDVVWVADTLGDGAAWADWQRRTHKDHVRKMERRRRKAAEEFGPAHVTVGGTDRALMERLVGWKAEKYLATGRHNIMGVRWIRAFLDELLADSSPDFGGELAVLWHGDTPVAIEFGMRAGSVLHSWFPAYDGAYASASPGVSLMEGMIRASADRGISRVDLGTGHAHYKKYCALPALSLFQGEVTGTGLRAGLRRAGGALSRLIERAPLGPLSALPGKFSRRLEQVMAAEPDLAGRARGLAWAVVSYGAADRAGRPPASG